MDVAKANEETILDYSMISKMAKKQTGTDNRKNWYEKYAASK